MTVEELAVGDEPRTGDRPARRPTEATHGAGARWLRRWPWLLGVGLVVAVVLQVVPSLAGPPTTSVSLVLAGDAFQRLDVDTGRLTDLSGAADPTTVVVQGSRVIALQPTGAADVTPLVLRYGPDRVERLGGADEVFPGPSGDGVWLVLGSAAGLPGSVAYSNAAGTRRTAVFPLPRRFEVVGAVPGGLLVTSGRERDRRLTVWDPSASVAVRTLGYVGTVLAVGGPLVTTTGLCWVGECPMYVVDVGTGERRDLRPPVGTVYSGRPVPSTDGSQVAAVVRRLADGAAALAVGGVATGLRIVPDLTVQPGATVSWTASGWLVVPMDEESVALWRAGQSRQVTLPSGTRVVAAGSS